MKILAISGSARRLSTNTALLLGLQDIAPDDIEIVVFAGIGDLPVFSPDLEDDKPPVVLAFMQEVKACDGILIASPEYVRTVPGGLKNAIDWLVSGDQIIGKPIALAHASHRGDDMLATLRSVLSTVSSNFNPGLFYRLSAMSLSPDEIRHVVAADESRPNAERFLAEFVAFCRECRRDDAGSWELGD